MKIKANLIKDVLTISLLSSPLIAVGASGTFEDLIDVFSKIFGKIIPFFMVLATVIFLWGVITYITAGGEEEKISSGRTYMLWGVIALFVMIAVWGLVGVITGTFKSVIDVDSVIPKGPK